MYIVFFIIIIILILGLIFSKITITIEKLEIDCQNIKFKITTKLLWFCCLPIFILKFNEKGVKVLWKKIKYKKNIKISNASKKINNNRKNKKLKKIKNLKIKTNLAKFTLKIGTEDIFITTFLVIIVSSLLTQIFKKTMKTINRQKINYAILPEFNRNLIYFEGKTKISFKVLNLINFI